MPETFKADLAALPAALAPLTEQPRWVVWRWIRKNGLWTKPPYCADDPAQLARVNDPTTWRDFTTAVQAVTEGQADGIGFMLKGSGVAALDLDHCRNAGNGTIDEWAADLISRTPGAYTEITASGCGLRVLGTAAGAELHTKFSIGGNGAAVELYRDATRYITVSGLQLGACDVLPNIDALLDAVAAEHATKPNGDGDDSGHRTIRDIIQNGSPEGRRSEDFNRVVWALAGMGRSVDEIEQRLAEYPDGIAAKYNGRLRPEIERCYAKWKARQDAEDAPRPRSRWRYHDEAPAAPTPWLIKNILPQTGAGLASGQWGSFKTTVALDMSVAVMAGTLFAGRFPVKRRGGVVYFALEGAGGLKSRLDAAAQERGVTGILPFAWTSDCPPLMAPDALDELAADVAEAAEYLQESFNVPVALIWVDTIVAAAGYARSGDDNDAAAAQRIMSALAGLSERTGALVIGIDHFGKVVETGTRGSSAKEGHADVVLALLADRELGGIVTNTRLAVRKLREGVAGQELPFAAKDVEIGTDPDGDPITRKVLDWNPPQASAAGADWSKSLQLLRRILMTLLADGIDIAPFADGPVVRAVDVETVRAEFYKQYIADGEPRQKAAARRMAFNRAVKDAHARSLIASREIDGKQLVWLAKAGAA